MLSSVSLRKLGAVTTSSEELHIRHVVKRNLFTLLGKLRLACRLIRPGGPGLRRGLCGVQLIGKHRRGRAVARACSGGFGGMMVGLMLNSASWHHWWNDHLIRGDLDVALSLALNDVFSSALYRSWLNQERYESYAA